MLPSDMTIAFFAGVLFILLPLAFGGLAAAQTPTIDWLDNLPAAQKVARETGRPLLIVFR